MTINFSTFEIGKRALRHNQLGIEITGQNIANVNTPGYTRQYLQSDYSSVSHALEGNITIDTVRSYRDRFLETRIQSETAVAGRLTTRREALASTEVILQGTENSGIQSALTKFFGSFRDLEANPSSLPLRTIAAQRGTELASAFQTTRAHLDEVRHDANAQVLTAVDQANSLSQQIASLNEQIRKVEAEKGNSNALQDQRGELVRQFSELTGARTVENGDGTISLTNSDGRPFVLADKAYSIGSNSVPPNGFAALTLNGDPLQTSDGKIKGYQDAIQTVSGQIDTLDNIAASIANRVNALHTSGTDFNGNAGVNFFDTTNPVTAANFQVNSAILADPKLVVASPLTQPNQHGTVAGQIAGLLTDNTSVVGSQTGSYSSIYGSLIADAGKQINEADNALQTQAAILAQVSAQRDSISGVSLDEEAINLLQYQRAFEAAAKFLKVADEMTQTILSLTQ
jgi:flagellar hook-associated protein 1 FlgK